MWVYGCCYDGQDMATGNTLNAALSLNTAKDTKYAGAFNRVKRILEG